MLVVCNRTRVVVKSADGARVVAKGGNSREFTSAAWHLGFLERPCEYHAGAPRADLPSKGGLWVVTDSWYSTQAAHASHDQDARVRDDVGQTHDGVAEDEPEDEPEDVGQVQGPMETTRAEAEAAEAEAWAETEDMELPPLVGIGELLFPGLM